MGYKVHCYICQKDFDSKKEVIMHIKKKHSDHMGTQAYKFYLDKISGKDAERVKEQKDLVLKMTNSGQLNSGNPVKSVKTTNKDIVETVDVNDVKYAVKSDTVKANDFIVNETNKDDGADTKSNKKNKNS